MINPPKKELSQLKISFSSTLFIKFILPVLFFFAFSLQGFTQQTFISPANSKIIDSVFRNSGEVYFKFRINNRTELTTLTRYISISKVVDNTVFAFANKKEFNNFLSSNYKYTLLTHPGLLLKPEILNHRSDKKLSNWDYYPTYSEYEQLMNQFASDHPNLCRLDTIGILPSGKKLLAVIISSDNKPKEAKPKFLYTSSMHGNELTGYVMMLRLIDTLLTGYGKSSSITHIIDNLDIYINPLANPDGTYRYSDINVYGSTRYNANDIDLNRNYPDPADGPHPDGNDWQPETKAFMDYAAKNHFTMSANLHTGSEVVNYPWDTWSRITADDSWWQCVSRQFADTVHKYSFSGFFTDMNDGITDGYQWYSITGGRQDYMNFYQHDRECTIELSNDFLPNPVYLPLYWSYFKRSFLNYIDRSTNGIKGIITDSITGKPIDAKIFINGHDFDSSYIYSYLPDGDYHRLINGGNYDITFSKAGYYNKTIYNVVLKSSCDSSLILNLFLDPIKDNITDLSNDAEFKYIIMPNPSDGHFALKLNSPSDNIQNIKIFDLLGNQIKEITPLSFQQKSGVSNLSSIDISGIAKGIYFTRIYFKDRFISLKTIIN